MITEKFEKVVITSRNDQMALEGLTWERVSMLPNGVDHEYFHPLDLPEQPDTVVLSGKISYYANAAAAKHFYKNVFPIMREKKPHVHLNIVGADPPASIRKLEADPGVTVTGYVEDIRPYIAQAAVAVCPITVGVGIQNKALESMAMKLTNSARCAAMRTWSSAKTESD